MKKPETYKSYATDHMVQMFAASGLNGQNKHSYTTMDSR
jgi:hypothetical protein